MLPENLTDAQVRDIVRGMAVAEPWRVSVVIAEAQTFPPTWDLEVRAVDYAGMPLEGQALFDWWLEDGIEAQGDPTVTVTTGSILQTVNANRHLRILTDANGLAVIHVVPGTTDPRNWIAKGSFGGTVFNMGSMVIS